jgi:hypothetical protein
VQYSEALGKKYRAHENLLRHPDFLSFNTPEGGVFLRCVNSECISVEGTTRGVFDAINKMIGWPAAPPALRASTSPSDIWLAARNPDVFLQERELPIVLEQ